jgi:hypothetical protein
MPFMFGNLEVYKKVIAITDQRERKAPNPPLSGL